MEVVKFLLTGLLILILDGIVLKLLGFGNIFIKMVNKIQRSKTQFKIEGFIIAYSLLTIQIYYFIVCKDITLFESFLLGLTTYGIFDFTNYTLFENYNLLTGIMDTIWGGLLYLFVNKISKLLKI